MKYRARRQRYGPEKSEHTRHDDETLAEPTAPESMQAEQAEQMSHPRYVNQAGPALSRMLLSMQKRVGNATVGSLLTAGAEVQRDSSEPGKGDTESSSMEMQVWGLGSFELESLAPVADSENEFDAVKLADGYYSPRLMELTNNGEEIDRIRVVFEGSPWKVTLEKVLIVSFRPGGDDEEAVDEFHLSAESSSWEHEADPSSA